MRRLKKKKERTQFNAESWSRSYFVEPHTQCADEAPVVVSYG